MCVKNGELYRCVCRDISQCAEFALTMSAKENYCALKDNIHQQNLPSLALIQVSNPINICQFSRKQLVRNIAI